jgi:outer membrane receptor protein involved in Fe transport
VESDSYGSDGPRQPSSYSFHLEDQLRAKNLQIDLGLRYEVLASDALTLVDPSNPVSNPFQSILLEAMKTTPAEHAFLPRFSASFFANEHLSLRASFGKYVQLPALREVYVNRGALARYLTVGTYNTNPRAMSADPIRTQQMAFGRPTTSSRICVSRRSVSQNDRGQLQVDFRNAAPGATINDYLFLANNGESTAQGVELALSFQKRGMHAWASYTFSNVHGFSSYSTSNLVDFFESFPDAERLPLQSESLDFNQQHRGNVLLSYQFDREAPLLLRQTGFYFAFRFNSGHNFPLYEAGDAFG